MLLRAGFEAAKLTFIHPAMSLRFVKPWSMVRIVVEAGYLQVHPPEHASFCSFNFFGRWRLWIVVDTGPSVYEFVVSRLPSCGRWCLEKSLHVVAALLKLEVPTF